MYELLSGVVILDAFWSCHLGCLLVLSSWLPSGVVILDAIFVVVVVDAIFLVILVVICALSSGLKVK
jgi:hypothetical protein